MTKREPKWWFVAYSVGLGAVVAAAAAVGGEPELGVVVLPIFAVAGVGLALTPWGTLRSTSQDEREQTIGRDAALVSYYAILAIVIGGFLVEVARGDDGQPWSLIGFVGGVSYLLALVVINRRS